MARLLLGILLLTPLPAAAQTFSHRGYAQGVLIGHPQTTPQDATRLLADGVLRWVPGVRHGDWRLEAAFDARTDSHERTSRTVDVTFWDRTAQRPVFAVSQLAASWARGPLTVEAGKQFVRWGKTDILVPTDRFAPRDYLDVVETELLAVTAARVTLTAASNSIEVVTVPRLTPSRAPLLDQRWVFAPTAAAGVPLHDAGMDIPAGTQYGVRWNRVGRQIEHSLSFFRGFDHLPRYSGAPVATPPLQIAVRRHFDPLTSVGGDIVVPLPWFTAKGEAAWLDGTAPESAEYVLYVIQLERQYGEWLFIGGYAGEHEIRAGSPFRFSPDRGLARAFIARASRTIGAQDSLVFETVARRSGQGVYGRIEYARGLAAHWRATATGVAFGGSSDDFLGRYSRNSSARVTLRYSF